MFITSASIAIIEQKYLGKRVQCRFLPDHAQAPVVQQGTVIGVAFNTANDAPEGIFGGLNVTLRPFKLIVCRDDVGDADVWGAWTLLPDEPRSTTLLDDAADDTISVEHFCALVGCTGEEALNLIDAQAQRNAAKGT